MDDSASPPAAFAHLFPEWALSLSLHLATRDPAEFWRRATYRPLGAAEDQSLSSLLAGLSYPPVKFERAFLKHEGAHFGIPDEIYRGKFWSLRPDFVAEADDASVFLILEAKGGQLSESVWNQISLTESAKKDIAYFEANEQRVIVAGIISHLKTDAETETRKKKQLRPNPIASVGTQT